MFTIPEIMIAKAEAKRFLRRIKQLEIHIEEGHSWEARL